MVCVDHPLGVFAKWFMHRAIYHAPCQRQSLTDVASIRVSQTALDAVDAVIADTPEQVVVSGTSALLEQLIDPNKSHELTG